MKRIKIASHLLALCLLLLASASLADAQAIRTWVSGTGNDANAGASCQRTAPCRTFAVALSMTETGGEINVLDPGDFGLVRINKSVTIDGGGVFAGIQLGGDTDAIVVDASPNSIVVLRGLTLNGRNNTGRNGVNLNNAGSLYIENCVIGNFRENGIKVESLNPNFLFVKDTLVRNNYSGGIMVSGNVGSTAERRAIIEKTRMEGNAFGARAIGKAVMTVRDCEAVGSGNAGYLVDVGDTVHGGGIMIIENSLATHNVNGLRIEGGRMTISNVTSIGNFSADIVVNGGGSFESYGNNRYATGPPPNSTNPQR